VQKLEQEIELFFNSIKSKETRIKYSSYLKKYLEITEIDTTSLLSEKDPRTIERQIIDFINKMKNEGKNWGAIHNYVSMILAFYRINDIVLNTVKISKFMPEQRKVKKDRSYTHEEISKMLEISDERTRVVILLSASTGMRIGAIPSLRIRNVDNYKITVYENDKEEYFTFMTPECKEAIDSYIDMRSRYGEKINDDSFLIREQFDIRDKLAIVRHKPMSRETLQWKLKDIAKRSNVRSKQVPIAHGFRKFFTTQLVNSKLNPEIREMLLGHKIGLASAYYRPTEQEMLDEYMKAVNELTINEENRLKIKVQLLERDKVTYEKLDAKIDALARAFYQNNVTVDGPEGEGRPLTEEEIEQRLQQRRIRANLRRQSEQRLSEI
jgi:integrase/recombinase XerD